MNRKLIGSSVLLAIFLPVAVLAGPAFTAPPYPAQNRDINIPNILNMILSWVVWPIATGIVIILFIMAGFIFLTAQGEPGKIATARNALVWGVVGVIVIVISFSIVKTVTVLLNLT